MMPIDLRNIAYSPDKFYMSLGNFDIDKLLMFHNGHRISQQQSIFIHEYYHYLTNIATFSGTRQFLLKFCDRYRAVVNLLNEMGLNAFPIKDTSQEDVHDLVSYWRQTLSTLDESDILKNVVEETNNTQSKKFRIGSIHPESKFFKHIIKGKIVTGKRKYIYVVPEGLFTIHKFPLTYGVIDEFLSVSIDEFLFQNDISEVDRKTLSNRPYYPYAFFDELLKYYDLHDVSAFEKILIAYVAVNSTNPPVTLIDILEKIKNGGYNDFKNDPECYLIRIKPSNPKYGKVLDEVEKFVDETYEKQLREVSYAVRSYYKKFKLAADLKRKDFFYFVRPFFATGLTQEEGRNAFARELQLIFDKFEPPLILKDRTFCYMGKTNSSSDATMLIIAMLEIFESLKANQIAKRPEVYKVKYDFPDGGPNCDIITGISPRADTTWRKALNELGLLHRYSIEALRKQ